MNRPKLVLVTALTLLVVGVVLSVGRGWTAGADDQPGDRPVPVNPAAVAAFREAAQAPLAPGLGTPGLGTQGRQVPQVLKDHHLSSPLVRLAQEYENLHSRGEEITALHTSSLGPELQAVLKAGGMRIDGNGRVEVYVDAAGPAAEAAARVAAAGGTVERVDAAARIVQASVPIGQLRGLGSNSSVGTIRLPEYGQTQAGSVTTQGDSILKAIQARSTYALNGAGVRVGVISDGVGGIGNSQASGDLPAVNTTTCNVIPGSNPQASGAEGTAMLEIVHDLAPGAELWFGHFGLGTSLDFNAAVDCVAASTDVVVDDIGFFGGRYDGTSTVSTNTNTELNRSTNRIRSYVTAVGNEADSHYQEPFTFCGSTNVQRFSATSGTVDSAPFGARCDNPLYVPPAGTAIVILQWNDPFGSSCNDYDLYLFAHNSSSLLTASGDTQNCAAGSKPLEAVFWTNPSPSVPAIVDIVIDNYNGTAAARTFDMFTLYSFPNFDTPGSSVPNQGDAGGGVISVGTINASDPGNDTIAYYSSLGPTNDGRMKPDITGIDCVSITGAAGFPNPFCGTSAAAPHVAGIAALLLQCKPSLKAGGSGDNPLADRFALRGAMLNHALDLGPAGGDNTYGLGRADALAAATSICPAPTPVPTPVGTPPASVPFGDVDCSGAINSVDALKVLRTAAGLSVILPPWCPSFSGDVDCNSATNSVDALKLLRYAAGLSVSQTQPCPTLGVAITPTPTPSATPTPTPTPTATPTPTVTPTPADTPTATPPPSATP